MPTESRPRYAILGMACRLPSARDLREFEALLFNSRSAICELPPERLDASLYFDPIRGRHGRTYTKLGGCVPEHPIDPEVGDEDRYDPTHRLFCETALRAWADAGLATGSSLAARAGLYVGHSGGTKLGGQLSLATQIEEALSFLPEIDRFQTLDRRRQRQVVDETIDAIVRGRPRRTTPESCQYHAYCAAALAARRIGIGGPRTVIDAACASSLLALNQAILALDAGRIDAAVVGGATYNNVDNLILFSHSQACSSEGSRPFDDEGSGLVSSEGYVAIVVTRYEDAIAQRLPVRAIIAGLGVSSDGRGKSLWAPRREGQELAIRRGYGQSPALTVDYLEAHATSTQLGDATELESLSHLRVESKSLDPQPLLIGSVKSNIGHTLEAAGLVGLVKLVLALGRREIPESINYRRPTQQFDWSPGRVQVVDHRRPWPATAAPRRGAVNAFGIGGLNAHVVVEEPAPVAGPASRTKPGAGPSSEAIAIVGRGVVLPGAINVPALFALLKSGVTAISDPPSDRWRPLAEPRHASPVICRGGYVTDYQFPAETYRIPPKQVRQANPLQLMLLDAVTQAMQECDGGQWTSDRTRTSVVIGTAFGGEFSNQLQVGLRLPEIEQQLVRALSLADVPADAAGEIAAAFRKTYLQNRPALLDETGSFTASTLASRVAKTFDLMGGACAVDADDASGLSAMNFGVDLLRSGQSDAVICGAANRALDLMGFEHILARGTLVESGRPEDVPENLARIVPGEGVAVVVLRRLSDALREQLPVFAVLDEMSVGQCADSGRPIGTRAIAEGGASDAELVRTIGYVAGAHGLIRLISESGAATPPVPLDESNSRNLSLESVAEDGFRIRAAVRVCRAPVASLPPVPKQVPRVQPQVSSPATASSLACRVVRITPRTGQEMIDCLQAAIADPVSTFARNDRFSPQEAVRLAVLAETPESLAASLRGVLGRWNRGQRTMVLDKERAIVWSARTGRNRIAWLFPGQGSQYAERPAVLDSDFSASEVLARMDAAAEAVGMPSLSSAIVGDNRRLGTDIWWTQAWVLGASACLLQAIRARGHRPDAVVGHSFGEFSAAVAAGALDLEQAVRIARQRAQAVVMCCREQGVLLSVRAMPSDVHAVLRQHDLPAIVTHHNAPRHTVIACSADRLADIQRAFSAAGMASLKIPVPAAFHTPMMAEAEAVFAQAIADERIRPPVCGFLSATTAEYAAEPERIRSSLVGQLTRPVLYEPTVRRLLRDGCGLLLEIGPNDILTRLNREIVGEEALCLSLDLPGAPFPERLAFAEAAMECVAGMESPAQPVNLPSAAPAAQTEIAARCVAADDVQIVDVRSRVRRRQTSPPSAEVATRPNLAPLASNRDGMPIEHAGILPAREAVFLPDLSAVHQFLVDLTVELTGYSPEVVDLDADLEADLGLDSIKKAQMIGELSEWAGLTIVPAQLRLSSMSSLRQIAALARMADIGAAPVSNPAMRPSLREAASPAPAPREALPPHVVAKEPSPDAALIEQLLIDYVIDQTGYSRDIIDLDADLEADLGVDSIKRAQLLGEMHEQFNLTGVTPARVSLNRFATLRAIRDFLLNELAERSGEAPGPSPSRSPDGRDPQPAMGHLASAPVPPGTLASSPIAIGPASGDAVLRRPSLSVLGIEPLDRVPPKWADLFADEGLLADKNDPERIRALGREHRSEIRAVLRLMIATGSAAAPPGLDPGSASAVIETLAKGAGVSAATIYAARRHFASAQDDEISSAGMPGGPEDLAASEPAPLRAASGRTHRFALRMTAAPRRDETPSRFALNGPVLILGDNPMASEIERRVQSEGGQSVRLPVAPHDIDARLEEVWKSVGLTPHVFITTPHDADSLREINAGAWQHRRNAAVEIPFRVCQLWMERMIAAGRMDQGSIVAVGNLGGDFGFGSRGIVSPEGGGMGGLLKAMVIESWMRGFRNTPMKVVDIAPPSTPEQAVDGIFRELAVPSYDMEVEVCGDQRRTVQAVAAPLSETARSRNAPQGAWILSGGGRGITALAGMALAEQYGLTLHLLGTAAVPEVTPTMRGAARSDRGQLRRDIMRRATESGENAIEAWRDAEKAIEIDATLQECRERGIRATYHCCDVSDAGDVKGTLEAIRRQDGPIRGVIHGAGAGQDARFDRKRPDKVDKCIRAKVDGCLTLMSATADDPLDWFVAFGSISGRFGANGHTDYSLANDMLAKIVDLFRQERPDVASLTFHWHAWGDVGMATKPEARLALEMIDMEFMPADDGVAHFLREFERGGDEPEVLITDHKYYRKFFPAERITNPSSPEGPEALPMIGPITGRESPLIVRLDPVRDLYLSQHLVNGRPTLPIVVALELMAEGARAAAGGAPVRACRNVEAIQALKFATNDSRDVAIFTRASSPRIGETQTRMVRSSLCADLRQRSGRIVESNREHFRGEFLMGDPEPSARCPWPQETALEWRTIEYPGADAAIYHGPELRSLSRVATAGAASFGRIGASAPVQLFGGNRPGRGWTVSCDTMDACLYACALHAWNRQQKASLPVRFDEIAFGRLPDPGEPCLVCIEEHETDERGMTFSFRLLGQNGDVLLDVQGYRIGWLQQ